MRLHYFINKFNLTKRVFSAQDKELINQLKNVLRLKPGNFVLLGDGNGRNARAEIAELNKNSVNFKVIEIFENQNEPDTEIILYCSVIKRENFELVVQKATEVGVKKIVPIICARTIKTGLKIDRLEKIAKEAAEQSGRGFVPQIFSPISFEKALQDSKNNAVNIFFDKNGEKPKLLSKNISEAGIFIGPEGGWTEEEVGLAKNYKLKIFSLGHLTLRAETAAIVASFLFSNPL